MPGKNADALPKRRRWFGVCQGEFIIALARMD